MIYKRGFTTPDPSRRSLAGQDTPNRKCYPTLAARLEEPGHHRLITDVQPQFTHRGGGFRFRVTDEAARLASDPNGLAELLIKITPPKQTFGLFLSYASADVCGRNQRDVG